MNANTSNQLMIPFTDEDAIAVKTTIAQVDAAMPFLLPLEEDAVKNLVKLDTNREGFIRDVITEMKNAAGKIPTLADLTKLMQAYALYTLTYDIEDVLLQLYTKVKRNRMFWGAQAYGQASRFYFDLDISIKDKTEGAAGIKKRLATYFAANSSNNGSNKSDKDNKEPKK
jgi:hypothetical protein